MIKECYEIRERYLHEWVSEGEKHLHGDMDMQDVARHIVVGEALKLANKACCIAKEVAGEEKEHHELMRPGSTHAAGVMSTGVKA